MRRNIVKVILLGFLLNITVGITLLAVVTCDTDPNTGRDINCRSVFTPADTRLLQTYDDTQLNSTIVDNFGRSISPEGEVEDTAKSSFRLLDTIGLGWIEQLFKFLRSALYGFVDFLDVMFGGTMTDEMRRLLFGRLDVQGSMGVMHHLISLGYVIVLFELWTNRKAAEE